MLYGVAELDASIETLPAYGAGITAEQSVSFKVQVIGHVVTCKFVNASRAVNTIVFDLAVDVS